MPAAQPAHKEFDKIVHVRDRLGVVVEENHYALHLIGESPYYERPVGSKNLFFPNGEPAGRMLPGHKVDETASHVAYSAPQTSDQKAAQEIVSLRDSNDELRKELEALRLEKEKLELKATISKLEENVKPASQATQAAPSKFAAHAAEKRG